MARDDKDQWYLDPQVLHSQRLAAIGELAAGIAHEINNPLAIIRQEAELIQFFLKKHPSLGPEEIGELQGALREIISQVDRSAEITRNLLDFARKRDPVLQGVEVNKLIEDMARLVEKEARLKGIQIIRQYDPELPLIFSDAPQLRQVILNLLTNAAHAIGKDGRITVTTCTSGEDAIAVTVADTGCGIPPEDLEKIFDPFFTTKPPGQGTGLGLSICHGIILRLCGRITVDSRVGAGAAFTITLPLLPSIGK
jgi:two-component system NtrC family sensor kinase